MIVSLTLAFGIITVGLYILYLKSQRPNYLPPGPPTLPFIGNLNLDVKNFIPVFRKLRLQYGDVYSLILGARTVIVINGTETLKEFFVKNADTTSERPDIFAAQLSKRSGLIGSTGKLWKEQRTFALGALREFGFGKRSIQTRILEEVEVVVKNVREKNGEPFDIHDLLHVSISNVMCSIIFGKRFDHRDEKFLKLLKYLDENTANSASIGMATFLPIIEYIPFDPFQLKKVKQNVENIFEYLKTLIKEHQSTYNDNDIRDFLDAYIRKINSDHKGESVFTEFHLVRVLADLFAAGTETTATTLRWFIIYCIRNPEIQNKMRKEIKDVLGTHRLLNIEDRQNLTYCEAVVLETLRLGNIVPFSLPHGLTREMMFKGYTIPKDAVIIPNLDSVLSDPNLFPDPDEFRPSRFIDKDGNLTGQDKILPFALGRRACLGESLARMELFLFATSLIQRFELLPEKDGILPDSQGVLGITYEPKLFHFRAKEIS